MTRHPSLLNSSRAMRLACLLFAGLALSSGAQAQATPVPSNVVSLQASGFLEVPQDWLTLRLSTTREATDPVTVQNQLKQALDAALSQARANAQPQQLEVRSGNFSLYPRYTSTGKISGWQGSTELILEGRDFARISTVAGRIQTLNVAQMGFSLSREARQKLESQVQTLAIDQFKTRASEVAQGFGFAGYTLREVSVSSANEPPRQYLARPMAMEAKAAMSDAAVPVEAGTATVNITVSGSIQLR